MCHCVVVQLLRSRNSCRHRDDHSDHLLQPGAACPLHRQGATCGHRQPHAQTNALQVRSSHRAKHTQHRGMKQEMCDVNVLLCVFVGIRATSGLLWSWVEWTVTVLTSTASTLTAPLTSCPTSPWVSLQHVPLLSVPAPCLHGGSSAHTDLQAVLFIQKKTQTSHL